MIKRNKAFEDMFHRLTWLHHCCEAHVDCYDHCPAYAICNCGHDQVKDAMLQARFRTPSEWTRGDRRKIARGLLHIE